MTIEHLIKDAYFKEEGSKPVPTGDMQKIAKVLNTASNLPYRPETYEAACGIMKIASQAFDDLLKKNAQLEKLSGVRDLIDDMFERGLISKADIQEKTATLMKKNENELEVVREAIKLASNTNGLFDSDPGPVGTSTSQNRSMFDNVINKE